MSDEDKIATAIGKGSRAESLLQFDVFNEAFTKLEADLIEAWKVWGASDTNGRERIWQAVNLLGKLKSGIVSVANNGKLARRELNDIAGKRSRAA